MAAAATAVSQAPKVQGHGPPFAQLLPAPALALQAPRPSLRQSSSSGGGKGLLGGEGSKALSQGQQGAGAGAPPRVIGSVLCVPTSLTQVGPQGTQQDAGAAQQYTGGRHSDGGMGVSPSAPHQPVVPAPSPLTDPRMLLMQARLSEPSACQPSPTVQRRKSMLVPLISESQSQQPQPQPQPQAQVQVQVQEGFTDDEECSYKEVEGEEEGGSRPAEGAQTPTLAAAERELRALTALFATSDGQASALSLSLLHQWSSLLQG